MRIPLANAVALPAVLETHVAPPAARPPRADFREAGRVVRGPSAPSRSAPDSPTGASLRGAVILLERPRGAESAYKPEKSDYAASFHPYTNEPGFHATLAAVETRGGAAVGVSGSLFEVAAGCRSSFVLSVDANPEIADLVAVLSALLAAVHADGEGNSSERLTRLLAPEHEREAHAILDDAQLDPAAARGAFSAFRFATRRRREANEPVWVDAPDAVQHLAGLAARGRIAAITADLADPGLPQPMAKLLAAHGEVLGALNLSNALDYVADGAQVAKNFAALPRQADAFCLTSSIIGPETQRHAGCFRTPRATSAKQWFGGVADRLVEDSWASPTWRKFLWSVACQRITGGYSLVGEPPESLEAYRRESAALIADTFSTEQKQAERLMAAVRHTPLMLELRFAGIEAKPPLPNELPTSLDELPECAARYLERVAP